MTIKLGDAITYLGADRTGLDRDLNRAERETRSWTRRVSEGIQQGIGQAFTNIAFSGVQKFFGVVNQGVRSLTTGMVGGNREFEQYNTQFEVLLKSAGLARQRMAELAEFGAKTPFELDGVVQADLVLQGFGLHAQQTAVRFGKSGAEIRTIAGDVASGTKASFEEMAGYLGRFSSGATGEAIARFQELGIVTRQELAGMGVEFSKSGELVSPLDEAMTILLQHMEDKYGGMMDAQSQTLGGMESNLADWVSNAKRILGEPIFELYKQELAGFLEFLNSPAVASAINGIRDNIAVMAAGGLAIIKGFTASGRAFFRALFGSFDTAATNLENSSGAWGRNIILQFARGMAAAAIAVVRVLNQIAGLIAYWLKPGSPPKILPDIDKWGTGAMQAYLDGFGSADVGTLKGITGRIKNYLSGMMKPGDFDLFSGISGAIGGLMKSRAKDDDGGLIGRILGSNEAIARAIADMRQMGGIGAQTMKMLEHALGSLPPVAMQYVQAALSLQQANERVAAAQEEVNRVTREYEERLRPLNAELDSINRKRANMADEKRIAALKEAISNKALSKDEEELALMEIRERELKLQIRNEEEAKTAALDTAESKLEAAQAEQKAAQEAADMQAAMLQAQQESNDLVNQQIGLLNQLANAVGSVGSALSAAGGGIFGNMGDVGDIGIDDIGDELNNIFEGLDIEGLVAEITAEFAPLNEEAGKLGEKFQIISDLISNLKGDGENGRQGLENIKDGLIILGSAFVAAKIATWVMGIVTAIQLLWTSGGLITAIGALVTALGGPFVVLAGIVAGFVAAWHTDFMGMRTTLERFWVIFWYYLNQAQLGIGVWWQNLKATVSQALFIVSFYITTWWTAVTTWLTGAAETITTWIEDRKTAIDDWWDGITTKAEEVGTALTTFKDTVLGGLQTGFDWVTDSIGRLLTKGGELITLLANMVIPDYLQRHSPPPLATSFKEIGEEMQKLSRMQIPALQSGFKGLRSPLGGGVIGGVNGISAAGGGITINLNGGQSFQSQDDMETFVELLRTMADDLQFGRFQGSPLGIQGT